MAHFQFFICVLDAEFKASVFVVSVVKQNYMPCLLLVRTNDGTCRTSLSGDEFKAVACKVCVQVVKELDFIVIDDSYGIVRMDCTVDNEVLGKFLIVEDEVSLFCVGCGYLLVGLSVERYCEGCGGSAFFCE